MVQSVRVLGFLPSVNGLHFLNAWPSGIPDYTFNVLGQTIKLGDAGNGLCGGMVFTVKDLFDTGLLPPTDTTDPAGGTPLFNYIVARLTNGFTEDNVNQFLSWIQMTDNDTILGHGLAWHEITEEWPKIKADLDANYVSPLGLVYGQEPPTVGFFTGIQDLVHCHQVLAWGYDLDGSNLTIYIYDPDTAGDENTITLNIANPGNTTPITISNWDGFYRGFFHYHYAYHDPRTPVSAAFIETVVSSPGISSAGPITPTWVDQILLESSGSPLVRFTGQVHDWSSAVSTAGSGEEILQLRTIIQTGGDDLRGGNGPNDNCDAILTLASGASITVQNINDGLHWNNGESHTVVLPLPAGSKVGDITKFTLHTQFGGGISGDNWNVDQLSLVASIPAVTSGQFTPVYAQGDPGGGIGGYDLIRPADQAFAFDYDSSGKLDHLVLYRPGTGAIFILANNAGQFTPVYEQGDPGNGIGGYDLIRSADRAFAFDYDSSGKLDHLVLYRPGTGAIFILKNSGGQFTPVYEQGDPGGGIGGYDLLRPADQAFAFDYDSSGKLDHLVFYRPGTGAIFILKNSGGQFTPVYAQGDPGGGIGGYDLIRSADRAFAFDYDSSGKLDHLVLYRPGTGAIFILKNNSGQFTPVYEQGDPGNGIGGYDLKSAADQAFAFDYDSSGKLDHLALYRPGTGIMWVLKNNGGQFAPVYARSNGIGGYDLQRPADRAFAFDYDSSGKLDHLVFYRPGTGAIFIIKKQ